MSASFIRQACCTAALRPMAPAQLAGIAQAALRHGDGVKMTVLEDKA